MGVYSEMRGLGPHGNGAVLTAGVRVEEAGAVLVMVHGRGGSAEDILSLFEELGVEGCAALAPQAVGNSWYPQSFLAPLAANQPYLGSALGKLEAVVGELLGKGIGSERIVLLGFSQGACLATEYAARHPRRYGGVIGLTGGLIGPNGTERNYAGTLAGTPVFLGSGDPDPHVPFARVEETRDVLGRMGAVVEMRRYAGMPHTINEEELEVCRGMVREVAGKRR